MTDTPDLDHLEDEDDIIQSPLPVRRRAARLAAVQALYQMDMSGEGDKPVIRQFRDHRFGHKGEAGMVEADEDFFSDIAALVVIDEYVSIASDFFDDGKEPGFVNGALEKLAKHVRKAEFGLI